MSKARALAALAVARIHRKDRAVIDPFTIDGCRAADRGDPRGLGRAQGNYDEFRFFTGLRPSEAIALLVTNFAATRGTLQVDKACVAGRDKDVTKNGDDRLVILCPRAMAVAARQLTLRARLEREGKIDHGKLFFKANGEPIGNLQYPYVLWRATLARLQSQAYVARHSSVSWDLMIGRSALWVARQHGQSIATMLRAYAAYPRHRTPATRALASVSLDWKARARITDRYSRRRR